MSIGDDGEDDELLVLGTMLCSVAVAIDDDDEVVVAVDVII